MVQSAVVDWSANLSRLHELIASGGPDRIPGESDEARVHRFLERLCRSLERQAPPRIRDRLQPDAILSLLLEKIPGFREGQGRFEAWCRVVVSHYAFDVCHRSRDALDRPGTVSLLPGEELVASAVDDRNPSAIDSAVRDLGRELRMVRQTLDEISWDPSPARQIDYYAVLLVQLRWAFFERLHGGLPSRDLVGLEAETWSGLIESCMPWDANQHARCFKPGWPSLADLWWVIAEAIDQTGSLSFEQFSCGLRTLCPETASLTPDLWRHWVKRAKDAARERMDPSDWDRLFRRLLPDRPQQRDHEAR
ncbi:MAG TPA: hypothetical protein VFF52_16505 [Isosphaeraceae bacterium]|nr:hypothetical protein [Isosphaeraceae bacterium]